MKNILTQWADKDKISKGIKVSIDVLFARTKTGAPPREVVEVEVIKDNSSPVKKKPVSPLSV